MTAFRYKIHLIAETAGGDFQEGQPAFVTRVPSASLHTAALGELRSAVWSFPAIATQERLVSMNQQLSYN